MSKPSVLTVKNLSVSFKTKKHSFYAAKDISFSIKQGETLSIVGESGCGKSTIAKTIVGIQPITSGEILYKNNLICSKNKSSPLSVKKEIQMIFQDPYSSLNPRMTIKEILKEPLYIYKIGSKKDQDKKVNEILTLCCLPKHYKYRYPHELSGGERQRVSIARALISNPKLLICDEPTHALDVSVQASIINLLLDLKEKLQISLLFISHDLGLVKMISDRTCIMYSGEFVEQGSTKDIFYSPCHPFTKTLLRAVPEFDKKIIPEPYDSNPEFELTSTLNNNSLSLLVNQLHKSLYKKAPTEKEKRLCPYVNKCSEKKACCLQSMPQIETVNGQNIKCHLYNQKTIQYFSNI